MKNVPIYIPSMFALTWSLLSLAPSASAQELNLGPIIDPGIAGQAAAQRQIAEQEYKRATGHAWHGSSGGKRPPTSGRGGAGNTVKGSTRFRVDGTARQKRVAAWMTKMRAVDAKGMAQFERTPAGRNLFSVIQPQLTRYSLRADDLADCLTVYLVNAWYGVRGNDQDPPRAYVLATRTQMRTSLLSNSIFATATDATKQEVAEALLLQTIEDGSNLAVAKKDPKQMPRVKSLIRQGVLKTFKLDMTKLKLTSQGLRA